MISLLAENEGRIYRVVVINAPEEFATPFDTAFFPCLLWDHGTRFTVEQRSMVITALLDGGCRYVVCGGDACELWHDIVDEEFVMRHLGDPDGQDAQFVETTRHEGESPDDVAFLFVVCTNVFDQDFQRYLVLHVGTGEAKEAVDAAVRKYAFNKNAD